MELLEQMFLPLKILKQRIKGLQNEKNWTRQEFEIGEISNIKLMLAYKTLPKEMKTIYWFEVLITMY